jgi:hypothetical protein
MDCLFFLLSRCPDFGRSLSKKMLIATTAVESGCVLLFFIKTPIK